MIRFLRQSTAIAATLALVMPQAGLAQFSIAADEIENHRAAMEAEQPQLAARLAEELATGLSAEGLTCAAPTQGLPCPEGTPLVTPGGLAVLLAEDGSILLAPPADQALAAASVLDTPAPILDEAVPEPTDAEIADEIVQEATDALPDEAQADEALPDEEVGNKPPVAKPDSEAAAEGMQEQVQDPPKPKPAAQSDMDEADAADAPEPVEADASDASAQEQAATESATSQAESAEEADDLTEDAEDETPAQEVAEADAVEADASADDATSSEPTATSGETDQAQADKGESEDDLAKMLAAIEAEQQDDTPPEARSTTPDEAAMRAAEGTVSDAAALATEDLDMAADNLETLTIGEDDARSSAVDFVTSIAQAVQETPRSDDGQEKDAEASAAATDDKTSNNRDRDIARALLAGLAGYAVGQMLPANQGQVALNSGDRVVITRPDGSQEVLKDDNALMFRPGAQVQTQNFDDGSSRVVVTREDGSRVITIRDADLRVLRRTLVRADGSVVKLIDDTAEVEPIKVSDLPPAAKPHQPDSLDDEAALRRALEAEAAHSRRFTLGQIRAISGVRALVAPISIDAITFDTGSAAITPDQARQLATLGNVIKDYIRANPDEMFLVEGYTDTVGAEAMNLALSDRRAESLALALTEYFGVPPENLVVQGYGERFLKVPVEGDVRQNRRVAVRRITDLLARD